MSGTNFVRITIITLIIITVTGSYRELLSWGLFNLFSDPQYSAENMSRVNSFDPDRDILYLPPLAGKDLFQSTRDLSICRKKEVRREIYRYLTIGREYLKRGIEHSYIYESTVREVLKNNPDIPEDIALLPLLESGFNPRAVSRSRAVGLWQFVDNTARPLGLQSNRWLDERRSVEKSTEAAIRHLRTMRKLFPSWELALAAYNGGAGYVKRAMIKTGTADFWALRESGQLRAETADYVPKFIALMLIYRNQRLFGISDEVTVPPVSVTEYFTLAHPADLRDIARLSGVPLDFIRTLNPELNENITPPAAKNYRLRIPAGGGKTLMENSGELYRKKPAGVKEYRVRKGDTISRIARAYKKKSADLIRINGIRAPFALRPGSVIYIPN